MIVPLSQSNHTEFGRPRKVCIHGSTGSIGKSALEVVRQYPDRFEVVALTAGSKIEQLATQAREFNPKYVGIAAEEKALELSNLLDGVSEVVAGPTEIAQLGALPEVDLVLAAIVGNAGLQSFFDALEAGKTVALANKESLVSAGVLVSDVLSRGKGAIIPVDSEHSAIFQLLMGRELSSLRSITLTASGGPFWEMPKEQFNSISPEQAVKHPRWSMGAKISIDSATLMNKALEVIEAHWLFGLPADKIGVVVHPQSIIHGLVDFVDGTQLAHLSVPDMKAAIAYALNFPDRRLSNIVDTLKLEEVAELQFYPVDNTKFPSIELAYDCIRRGGGASLVLNSANEAGVEAFMDGKLTFDRIVGLAINALEEYADRSIGTLEEVFQLDLEVRGFIKEQL